MDLLKPFRRYIQRKRVQNCSYHVWEIHHKAEDIWIYGGPFGTEFVRGEEPKEQGAYWYAARVATCRKCGGTLDEIKLANNVLGEKTYAKIWEYKDILKYTKGCGTTYDWRR